MKLHDIENKMNLQLYNIKHTEKELWSFNFLYLDDIRIVVFNLYTVFSAFTPGLKYGDLLTKTHAIKNIGINCKRKGIVLISINALMHLFIFDNLANFSTYMYIGVGAFSAFITLNESTMVQICAVLPRSFLINFF